MAFPQTFPSSYIGDVAIDGTVYNLIYEDLSQEEYDHLEGNSSLPDGYPEETYGACSNSLGLFGDANDMRSRVAGMADGISVIPWGFRLWGLSNS